MTDERTPPPQAAVDTQQNLTSEQQEQLKARDSYGEAFSRILSSRNFPDASQDSIRKMEERGILVITAYPNKTDGPMPSLSHQLIPTDGSKDTTIKHAALTPRHVTIDAQGGQHYLFDLDKFTVHKGPQFIGPLTPTRIEELAIFANKIQDRKLVDITLQAKGAR